MKAASVRNDAAAELDRLTRGSKKSTVAAPNALNNNDAGGSEAKSLNSSECWCSQIGEWGKAQETSTQRRFALVEEKHANFEAILNDVCTEFGRSLEKQTKLGIL